MRVSFCDNVRIRTTKETEAAGLAGLVGNVHGETTPSVTRVEVIGTPAEDRALSVHFEDLDRTCWFAPELVEFVDHAPGTEIRLAGVDKRWIRTEDGGWKEESLAEENAAIRWLKTSYLAGAVADAVIGVLMLIPGRMGELEFRYPMGLGAALMFGWAALLLWAYREPMRRKGILVLTIFPVITGLLATGIWAVAAGHLPVQRVVPSSILGVALIFLMGFSYSKAARAS